MSLTCNTSVGGFRSRIAGALLTSIAMFTMGCASVESIRPVVDTTVAGFNAEQYDRDLATCRAAVAQQVPQSTGGQTVALATAAGALAGAGVGASIGAVEAGQGTTTHGTAILPDGRIATYTEVSRPRANPVAGAVYGTAAGAAIGLAGGLIIAEQEKQRVYRTAIAICLANRGYQILDIATGGWGRPRKMLEPPLASAPAGSSVSTTSATTQPASVAPTGAATNASPVAAVASVPGSGASAAVTTPATVPPPLPVAPASPASPPGFTSVQQYPAYSVHLTTERDVVANCGSPMGMVNDDELRDLWKKIIRRGGNTAVLSFDVEGNRIYAEVFRCAR